MSKIRQYYRLIFGQNVVVTHGAATFTAPLYPTSAKEREIVCCFLLEQKMEPLEIMKRKPEVEFLSLVSPSKSESENPTSSSGELGAYYTPKLLVPCTY